jgi:hypothetical protein
MLIVALHAAKAEQNAITMAIWPFVSNEDDIATGSAKSVRIVMRTLLCSSDMLAITSNPRLFAYRG